MYQKIPTRPTHEPTPTEQDRADAEETARAKAARDGLIAWRAIEILGASLAMGARARDTRHVLDTILHAAQDFVFLEYQTASLLDDKVETKRLARQWQDIHDSRGRLELVRR
jgi:hypothetical protein